jgi:hypothetical protein
MTFGLVIGFTDHLRIVITSNYKSLAVLLTSFITVTTAHIKSSVFTSRFLVTDFNTARLGPYHRAHVTQLN